MSRPSKIIAGIFSFLPLIAALIVVMLVLTMIPQFAYWKQEEPDFYVVWATIWPLIITGLLAGILKLAALIYFIINMLNNKRVLGGERVIWVLVFIFTGGIGFPIYWYMRIWKEEVGED